MSDKLQTVDTSTGNSIFNYSAKKNELPDSFFSPDSVVTEFRNYLPEHDRSASPLWLRKELLTNDNYLNNVVSSMFSETLEDPDLRAFYDENPDQYDQDYIKVKNDIYRDLVSEVYQGDDITSAITKRERNLIYDGFIDIYSENLKGVINANKDRYKQLEILDSDGNFLVEGESLKQKILQNEDLLDVVVQDQYEQFQQSLGLLHNAGGIDTNNVDQMAQAYTVFREFGKEGLTQFINFYQEYDLTKPFEEQSQKAQRAAEFVERAQHNGRDIGKIMQEFFGGEEEPQGQFELDLPKESLEMLMDVEKDLNAFTYYLAYNDEDKDSSFKNFFNEYRSKPTEFTWYGFMSSLVGLGSTSSVNRKAFPNKLPEYLKRTGYAREGGRIQTPLGSVGAFIMSPFDDSEKYYEATEDELLESVNSLVENGVFNHQVRGAVFDIAYAAKDGELFTFSDLLDTALVHSTPTEGIGEIGADLSKRDLYRFNYEDAPAHAILAVEALRNLENNMVRETGKSGEVIIEPDYRQRLNTISRGSKVISQNSYEYVPVYDEAGRLVGGQEVPSKDGFIARSLRKFTGPAVGTSIGHGIVSFYTDWVDKALFQPLYDIVRESLYQADLQDSMLGRGFFSWFRSHQEMVGQFLDLEPHMETNLDMIAFGGAQMGAYLHGTLAIGNAAMSPISRFRAFKELKDYKNLSNTEQVLSVLQPNRFTKLGNFGASLGHTSKNMSTQKRALHNWAKIEVGEIVRQPITPPEHSIYQLGRMAHEFGWWEDGEELTRAYEQSNRIAQIGADMAGNFAVSMLFDNLFATARFATNWAGMRTGLKKTGNSWKMENGAYKKLPKEEYNIYTGYSPDMRRLVSNAIDDMTEMPMGDITNTLNNYVSGKMLRVTPTNANTVHDIAKLFKDDADLFMDGMWENVRNTLESYDKLHSGRMARSVDLDERANRIVEKVYDNMADELTEIFHQGNDSSVGLRFARALREQEPTDEFVPFVGNDGIKQWTMSLENAQTLQNQIPFSTIIRHPDGTASVTKIDPNFWSVRLADKIELKYNNKRASQAYKDYVNSRKDLDIDSTNPEMVGKLVESENTFNHFFRKGVVVDGERGIITGLEGDNLIVRMEDGSLRKGLKQADFEDQISEIRHSSEESALNLSKVDGTTETAPIFYQESMDALVRNLKKVEAKFAKQSKSQQQTKEVIDRINQMREIDSTFKSYGVPEGYWNTVGQRLLNYSRRGKASFRKMIANIGHNGVLDYNNFGVNIGPVQPLDMNKVRKAGGLKKNTVFTKNTTGTLEHFITVRKTPKDFPTTVWVRDADSGELVMNPYIRRIDENQTFEDGVPVLYKPVTKEIDGVKRTVYTRAKKKEKGFLINVQRPVKDIDNVSEDRVFEQGIDALVYESGNRKYYRLIDENNQVVDPATFKERSLVNDIPELHQARKPTKEDVAELFPNSTLAKELAKSANANLLIPAGIVADFLFTDEDSAFPMKFTAMGLAGTALLYGNGMLGGAIRKGVENTWNQKIVPMLRHERKVKEKIRNVGLGEDDLLRDPGEKSIVDELPNIFGLVESGAAGLSDAIFRNSWTQSQFSFLKKMDIPVADEFRRALMGIEGTIGSIISNPEQRFVRKVYNTELKRLMDTGLSEADASKQIADMGNMYNQFVDQIGPERTRQILEEITGDTTHSDTYVRRMFGASFARVMAIGATRPDHVDRTITNRTVLDAYSSGAGNRYRELDRRLLGDEQFQQFAIAHREWFSDIKTRWIKVLDDSYEQVARQLRITHGDKVEEIARSFYSSGKTKQSFRKAISESVEDKALFDRLQEVGQTWDEIEYLATRYRKFSEIENYYPQVNSQDAIIRAKSLWESNPENLSGATTPAQIDRAWETYQIGRYIEVNADSEKLSRLKRLDNDTGELEDIVFSGRKGEDKARRHVLDAARELRREGRTEDADRLLNESTIQARSVRVRNKESTEYIVQLPEDLAFGENGINRKVLEKYYRQHLKNLQTPESNFLDRPRVSNVPHEFLEVDPNRIRYRYGRDAGRRIHNAENEMLTGSQLDDRYINPIRQGLAEKGVNERVIDKMTSRLTDIYRVANGLVGDTQTDFRRLQKRGFASNIYRNFQFLRYGYGFGNYNLFEWAAVGQHIGGGFTRVASAMGEFTTPQGADSIANYENLLRQENIFRKEIQFARPEFKNIGVYDYSMDDALSKIDYGLTKGANWLGNFSIGDRLMGALGGDISKTGAFRVLPIVGDSFLGSSMFNSAVVSRASLAEASHLARLSKELSELTVEEGAPRIIRRRGRVYSEPEIERQLENLGILPENQKAFVEGRLKFEQIVDELNTQPNFTAKIAELRDDPQMSQYMDMVIDVVRNATESYNGINKIYRPEAWDSDIGRTLSMYSTYPFNVSVQVTQRRIKQPMDDWFNNYGNQLSQRGRVLPAVNVWSKIQMGQYDKLREMGLSTEAIEAFPSEAVFSTLRVFNSLGISVAGYIGLDMIRDLVAWSLSPISGTEQEEWSAFERGVTINPAAPERDRITLQDLFDEGVDRDELKYLMTYTLGTVGRLGLSGRYFDAISNPWMQHGGLSSIAPITGDIDNLLTMSSKFVHGNASYYTDDLPAHLGQQLLRYTPILGANTFSQYRRDITNTYLRNNRSTGLTTGGKSVR